MQFLWKIQRVPRSPPSKGFNYYDVILNPASPNINGHFGFIIIISDEYNENEDMYFYDGSNTIYSVIENPNLCTHPAAYGYVIYPHQIDKIYHKKIKEQIAQALT